MSILHILSIRRCRFITPHHPRTTKKNKEQSDKLSATCCTSNHRINAHYINKITTLHLMTMIPQHQINTPVELRLASVFVCMASEDHHKIPIIKTDAQCHESQTCHKSNLIMGQIGNCAQFVGYKYTVSIILKAYDLKCCLHVRISWPHTISLAANLSQMLMKQYTLVTFSKVILHN